MAATSLQTMIERIAGRAGVLYPDSTGFAATSGSTTTVVNTSVLWQSDNRYWDGAWCYIKTVTAGAAPQGDERQVKSYTASSGTLTVGRPFSAAVSSAASAIQLYSRWSRADILNAINDALRNASGFWWRPVVDESLTTSANTYSFDLSSLSVPVEERYGLSRVWVRWNTTYASYPYHEVLDWVLRWNGATPTLQFARQYPASRVIRLEYIASPTALTAAGDTSNVDTTTWIDNFIEEWALFYLYQLRMGFAPAADKRMDGQLAQQFRDEAERLRRMHAMRLPPGKARAKARVRPEDEGRYLGAFSTPGP